jgi:5-methylcytosine-specific restriction endonuclease McrA
LRDNCKCQICGASPAHEPIKLEVDHIHPWAKGGETILENLQTLCTRCNGGKSDLIFVEGEPV